MTGRRKAVLALGALAAGVYLLLAWNEQVPGGWRLRNLFEPHAEREARRQAAWRAERLEAFAAEPAPAEAPVVFLGSSTIERFPLTELFPGAVTLNRGIGFEGLADLQQRLEIGVPDEVAAAVLYVGSIDHRFRDAAPRALALGVQEVIAALRGRLGPIPIATLGLLGERDLAPEEHARLLAANEALERATEAVEDCWFVATDGPPLMDAQGRLDPALSTDALHLTVDGYRELATRLLTHGGAVAQHLQPWEPK